MTPRRLIVLPLLFLGAAAAPSDCNRSISVLGSNSGTLSDVASRTQAAETPPADGYSALRSPDMASGCQTELPSVGVPSTLRNTNEDVMHGLPSSGSLAPVNQPQERSYFR